MAALSLHNHLMNYHAMRMRHARARIGRWLARWGIWLLLVSALLTLGNDPLTQATALPVALALPLFTAAGHGPAWLAAATLVYALAGALPVWLTRPLWWPALWAQAERALPLPAAELAASDRRCVRWGWLPLQALLAVGAATICWLHPMNAPMPAPVTAPEWPAARAAAVAALLVAAWASAHLSRAALRHWRQAPAPHAPARATARTGVQPLHPAWPLLLWPLARGPARRSGRALALLLGLAPVPAWALWHWPGHAGWALASATLWATAGAALLRRRLWDDLTPLWAACAPLPLPAPPMRAARWLAWGPAVLAVALLLTGLPAGWRALPLTGWLALTGLALQRATAAPGPRADHDAAWTLLALALALAFGSEVAP